MKKLLLFGCLLVLCATGANAVTPAKLIELQQQGLKIRLIDVRSGKRFEMGSIPGAMSMPHKVLLEKSLPRLGRVVLFSDGLGNIDMDPLVKGLNQRPGIQAEILEGGYAAWLDEKGATTAKRGVRTEDEALISYKALESLKQHVILVDMRSDKKKTAPVNDDTVRAFCKPSSREYCSDIRDLQRRYSRANVRGGTATTKSKASHAPTPLIVLVDDDHSTARAEKRRLRVAGYNRVVVLSGGEFAIQTKGTRGLGRVGGKVLDGSFSTDGSTRTKK